MNIGFPHKRADEKAPETVKFKISIKPVEKVFKQDGDKSCDKHIDKNFDRDQVKDHNKEYEKECVKDNSKNYDKESGKDRSKDYEKDLRADRGKVHEKDCGKDYEKDCGKDYEKDCGKDCEKDYEKDCGKDFEKDNEKDCGKDREKDYEKDCGKDRKNDYDKDCRKDREKDCGKDYDNDKNNKLSICTDYYCISEEITVNSCDDLVCFNLGDIFFKQNGFILELSLKLKDICPKRHTALAVVLYELDKCEKECLRGFKTVLLPLTGKYVCSDICVNCLRFVIPQALDINDDCNSCGPRKFVVRFIANYVDSDFNVCGC